MTRSCRKVQSSHPPRAATADGGGIGSMLRLLLIVACCGLLPVAPENGHAATNLTYTYDANGNMISGDGKYYEYNDANQLARVRVNDAAGLVIAEYFYDSSGQRVKKVESGVTTYYIGKHYESVADGGILAGGASNYFHGKQRVASTGATGEKLWFGLDHLGSTSFVASGTGSLAEKIAYYPFGQLREGATERYTYLGKEKDGATGQYYFEARYFIPSFMHFAQADNYVMSVRGPQDLNRYSYAGNNPLRFADPTGNWEEDTVRKSGERSKTLSKLMERKGVRYLHDSDLEQMYKNGEISKETYEHRKGVRGLHFVTKDGDGNTVHNVYLSEELSDDEAAIVAGHELTHAKQYDEQGANDMSAGRVSYDRKRNARETQARVFESKVWRELGKPDLAGVEELQVRMPSVFGTIEGIGPGDFSGGQYLPIRSAYWYLTGP